MSKKDLNKNELKCPYCGKRGFKAKGPLNSHIKAVHPNQQEAPGEGMYPITYHVKKLDTPGHQVIACPACNRPRVVYIKEDGTIASTDDPEIPEIPSSSGVSKVKARLRRNAHPITIQERYKMRWNEEENRWKNTVAMSGTHGKTAPEMPWHELGIDEFWTLNDMHGVDYMKEHFEAGRVSRHWQVHHRWRVTRRQTRYATDHWQWLQDVRNVPRIMMQRKFREVPNSEGFKFKEITQMFLGDKLGRGAGYVQYYYTNTFAYMFAQIAYEKATGIKDWERIELYGCELEQLETEYFRQRPGIEFWFGIMVNMGIEIYVPQSCFMAYAQDVTYNPTGQKVMVQYPGYMAYGYKSPSLEEVKERNVIAAEQGFPQEPIGVDPVEENVIGAWDDVEYMDFIYAMNEQLALMERRNDLSDFDAENAALNEWLDTNDVRDTENQ